MAKTIFTMFSVNEHKPIIDHNGKIDIQTEIETDHDVHEANDIQVELTEVANECSNTVEVNAELTEQAEANTELIENNPEQVTEEIVQVAQENFAYTLGRLGLSKEELLSLRRQNAYQVSLESDNSAITKLKISTEGIKEFLEKLIQKVKDIFAKFFNLFKKFLLKLRKMMDASLARANVLLKSVKEDAEYSVSGDSLDYVNSMFISMQAIDGSTKSGALEIEKGNDAIKAMVTALANMSSKLSQAGTDGFWTKLFGKSGAELNFVSTVVTALVPDTLKIPVKLAAAPLQLVGKLIGAVGKGSDQTPPMFLIRFMNKKVKVVTFKVDSGINACEIVDLGGAEWPNLKPFKINGKTLKKYLEIAKSNAENVEQYQDSLNKIVRESKATLAKVEKLKKSTNDKAIAFLVNILGRLSTTIIIEMTNNYLDYNKGIVKLGSMLISSTTPDNDEELKKKAKEEKEKKKQEEKDNK